MKTKLLLLVMVICYSVNAQTPDYFAENPEWRVNRWFGAYGDCIEVQDYVNYLHGDSLIGEHLYKKVMKRGISIDTWVGPDPPYNCDNNYSYHYIEGLVRQEGKKMYINDYGSDILLYDFDLEIGDTLQPTYVYWMDNFVVASIDSILIGDSYRKVFNLIAPWMVNPEEFLIEGIGFGGAFIDQCPFQAEFPSYLECFTLNDTAYFPEYGAPCELNINVQQHPVHNYFKLYPNPVSDQLTISYPVNLTINNVTIYNFVGKKVQEQNYTVQNGELFVNMAGLANGLYIIELTEGNLIVDRHKVIKQ